MLRFLRDCLIEPPDDIVPALEQEATKQKLVTCVSELLADIEQGLKGEEDLILFLDMAATIRNYMQELKINKFTIDNKNVFVLDSSGNLKLKRK